MLLIIIWLYVVCCIDIQRSNSKLFTPHFAPSDGQRERTPGQWPEEPSRRWMRRLHMATTSASSKLTLSEIANSLVWNAAATNCNADTTCVCSIHTQGLPHLRPGHCNVNLGQIDRNCKKPYAACAATQGLYYGTHGAPNVSTLQIAAINTA